MPLKFFPVAGGASYSSDFSASRPGARSHQGNDLMADEGTALIAVDDGEVHFGSDPLGGNIANLYADDNTRYYYAHLSSFEGGAPRRVSAGEVIGYVGRTGNAINTAPHLHFEIHPNRGEAIDPYPILREAPLVGSPQVGSPVGSRKVLTAVLLAGVAGIGVWTLLNPRPAERLVKRWLPG